MDDLLDRISNSSLLHKVKLIRGMKHIRRGQVLSFRPEYTIESHMYQMTVLFMIMWKDEIFFTDHNEELFNEVLYAIITHDIGEVVIGDIPWHTKRMINYDDSIESKVISTLIDKKEMSEVAKTILDLLDMLEFHISLSENRVRGNIMQETAYFNSEKAIRSIEKRMLDEGYICSPRKFKDFIDNIIYYN